MSTTSASGAASQSAGEGKSVDWAALAPKNVDYEDSMSAEMVNKVWAKIYKAAGLRAGSENEQRAVRAAVYVYGCKNGTSREGNYSGYLVTSDGKKFPSSVIPTSTGKLNIRKFYRGNMLESYDFLKTSGVMEMDERFVSRWAKLGISSESAFATADWMADCPKFTPVEEKAHLASFNSSIKRASTARGDRTLEQLEEERVDRGIEAQRVVTDGREVKF